MRERGPAAALGLFTVLPAPFTPEIDRALAARAIRALPWLGLALGVLAGAVALAVRWRTGSDAFAAVSGLLVLQGLTGAMHLDGLADTADGLGSRRPASEALVIMRRSDIGPMGVTSIVLLLALDVAALATGHGHGGPAPAVLVGPAVARCAALTATRQGVPGARESGFGALFVGVTGRLVALLSALLVTGVAALAGWVSRGPEGMLVYAVAAAVALVTSEGWRSHLSRRLGGLTGDTFGSLIETTQAVFWVLVALL